jgi:hypothetical protein
VIRLVVIALLSVPLVVHAMCPDGEYVVAGEPLLASPGGVFVRDVVTIAGGTVAIASGCPATTALIKVTRRGTVVKAAWPHCGDALRVRLRAIVGKSCGTMHGRFTTRRPRTARRFFAERKACEPGTSGCGACHTNADCGADHLYCAKPGGQCDAGGACLQRPQGCTREYIPVCGCDGVTYSNRCDAAAHGANVGHAGPCDGERCGGFKGVECSEDEFCELPPRQCDVLDLTGRCVAVPDACVQVYDPVCGCDGVTYGNDCDRQAAKAQKAHDGRCADECKDACDCARTHIFPEPCPLECATCDNYWTCDDGTCVPHCGPVPQPPPVCEPRICGGIAGVPCPNGQLCDLPAGECGTADLQGVCVDEPGACPDIYRPVCGCDGITYSNECERLAAYAQKDHDGECGFPCADACDCEKSAPLPAWCDALLCPACGCTWVCESLRCEVQIESPPPPSACLSAL